MWRFAYAVSDVLLFSYTTNKPSQNDVLLSVHSPIASYVSEIEYYVTRFRTTK